MAITFVSDSPIEILLKNAFEKEHIEFKEQI